MHKWHHLFYKCRISPFVQPSCVCWEDCLIHWDAEYLITSLKHDIKYKKNCLICPLTVLLQSYADSWNSRFQWKLKSPYHGMLDIKELDVKFENGTSTSQAIQSINTHHEMICFRPNQQIYARFCHITKLMHSDVIYCNCVFTKTTHLHICAWNLLPVTMVYLLLLLLKL